MVCFFVVLLEMILHIDRSVKGNTLGVAWEEIFQPAICIPPSRFSKQAFVPKFVLSVINQSDALMHRFFLVGF